MVRQLTESQALQLKLDILLGLSSFQGASQTLTLREGCKSESDVHLRDSCECVGKYSHSLSRFHTIHPNKTLDVNALAPNNTYFLLKGHFFFFYY